MLKNLLVISFLFIGIAAFGQEICNNGIDDDGDGLVDCFDPQCNGTTDCSDFFYGKPATSCSTNPTNPVFSLNTTWQSNINVSTRSTMMVGDMDADGIPEVVCHQDGVNQLYILDGVTGSVEVTINCPAIADHVDAITIGDTDDDGLGEIYVVTNDNKLRCFENDGTAKIGFTPPTTGGTNESIPGIADFNQDGIPEIYKDNKIYNSLTGVLIASGTGSTGNNPGSNGSPAGMPVAADVLPDSYCVDCSGLELVCGNAVYAVDIPGGTITPVANSLPGSLQDGFTSVADIDVDGQLDVVVVSNGTVYVWDPRTGLQIGNTFNIPNTNAGGRANIADYDNDGLPEIGAGGMNRYVVIDIDTATNLLSQKWIKTIVDGSEHTTSSVFDFDCDGKAQVVYRDENVLYVWDGETGNVQASLPCGSATRSEFPTIVDVDGDGQVNIICACASGNGGSAGKVMAFNSSTNQWVGSRTVMNQHSYFVTNINDDLSIPIQQQNHALLPKINGFLAQAPVYDVNWNSTCIPLADVTISIDSVIYCQKPDSVIMELTLCNIGSKVTTSPIDISVYNGNPISGGTLISMIPLTNLIYSDSCLNTAITVPFSGSSAIFYVYVNDDGSSPANAPQTTFVECDSSNNSDFININVPVISIVISGDTILCNGDSTTLTATGATIYNWSPSTTLSDSTGPTVTAKPLATQSYTVSGTDTNTGCSSTATKTVTINPNPVAIFGNSKVCKGFATQFTDTSASSTGTVNAWMWRFGDGDSLSGIQHPTHVYGNAGNYNTILIVGNSLGCKDTTTKSILVYNNPVSGFIHNDVCYGDTTHFTGTSSVLPPDSVTSYQWIFDDGNPNSISQNPDHFYINPGTYNVKLVVTTNNGCIDSLITLVNAFDAPTSLFTVSNTCQYDSAELVNSSANPSMATITGWQWDFGDQTPSGTTDWNPNHLYASSGNYIVTLVTYTNYPSNLSCSDTLSNSVTIFPSPIAGFSSNEICLSDTTDFIDSSSVLSGSITAWSWNFVDNSAISTIQQPTHIYTNFGIYTTTLVVTSDNGCIDSISKNTLIHPPPNAMFGTEAVCSGSNTNFIDLSTIPSNIMNDTIQSWTWNLGDSSSADGQNPTHLYSNSGLYSVQLLVVSSFGCLDSITKTAVVNPNPAVVFTTNDTSGCSPLCVPFQTLSFVNNGSIASWSWNFGDSSSAAGTQDVIHCYANTNTLPVSFSPTLTVTSDSSCIATLTKNGYITVFPQPDAQFIISPQSTTITDPAILITNTSTIATLWNWDFGDSATSIIINPALHTYADTGAYLITLIASTQYNCIDTTYQTVIIEPDFLFFIPNSFTPDGDGVNDTFTGKGLFITEYEMFIFDRWGNTVYRTDDLDKPWDGKANHGNEISQQDVYVYSITVKDFKQIKHNYKGIVNLVR